MTSKENSSKNIRMKRNSENTQKPTLRNDDENEIISTIESMNANRQFKVISKNDKFD